MAMMCQLCGERVATVCLNIDINGVKCKQYICEECAEKHRLKEDVSPAAILRIVKEIKRTEDNGGECPVDAKESKCSNCGMLYSEFLDKNALGCEHCYDEFADMLEPIIKAISKNKEEPARGTVNINSELLKLQLQLKRAVEAENYEEAAILRDKIIGIRLQGEADEQNG